MMRDLPKASTSPCCLRQPGELVCDVIKECQEVQTTQKCCYLGYPGDGARDVIIQRQGTQRCQPGELHVMSLRMDRESVTEITIVHDPANRSLSRCQIFRCYVKLEILRWNAAPCSLVMYCGTAECPLMPWNMMELDLNQILGLSYSPLSQKQFHLSKYYLSSSHSAAIHIHWLRVCEGAICTHLFFLYLMSLTLDSPKDTL